MPQYPSFKQDMLTDTGARLYENKRIIESIFRKVRIRYVSVPVSPSGTSFVVTGCGVVSLRTRTDLSESAMALRHAAADVRSSYRFGACRFRRLCLSGDGGCPWSRRVLRR